VNTTFTLNDAQRAAVEHPAGPVLVIAGAGSGKTRVLTARVARALELGSAPDRVLAFTFTNRAAREMRERIGGTVGDDAARLWVGTFHGTGVRILRREAGRGGLPGVTPDFTIYDREDQESLLREVMAALQLPEAFRLGEVLARISDAKNALVSPAEAERAAVSPWERRIAETYGRYQAELSRRGALDFDDLIGEVVTLFRQRPEVLERYARKFEHVLVDEYQDTNHAQFRLVVALAGVHRNLFAVGDEDQSIYRFRGADIGNILDFENSFPGAAVLRLEQNYRSTGNILKAANAVIANNRDRKGKTLWCDREDGPRLRFVLASDEVDEARRIASTLADRVRRGGALSDSAVLYRTNAQSRALETELRQRGMRYEIVGGVSFYQRREVKDVLAYLRLAVNPADQVAFWRCWNTPRRGLGDAVRARVERRLSAGTPHPTAALREVLGEGDLARPARAGAEDFLGLIEELRARAAEPADLLVGLVLRRSAYLAMLDELPPGEAADRRANVEELAVSAGQFASSRPEGGLAAWLAETALLTDADRLVEGADRVLLLTAHNAKGLEFPLVIVAGLEEGLMPHGSSLESPAELEEERRLFYVALTRARDEVLLTAAAYRRRFDGARGGQVSRFVDEIPAELLDREEEPALPAWSGAAVGNWPAWSAGGPGGAPRRPPGGRVADTARSGPAYRTSGALARTVGREVFHDSFGRGVVVAAEGEGADLKFTVRFGTRIVKVLGRFLTGGTDAD